MNLNKVFAYLFCGKDDDVFFSFSKKKEGFSGKKGDKKILVDFSHALYKKWNFKNHLIIKSRAEVAGEVQAFYPSKFFLWFSVKMWSLNVVKSIYNKDKKVAAESGCDKFVAVPFFWGGVFSVFRKSIEVNRKVTNKEDVLALTVDSVYIGDLIYDTYLKWFKKETVDVTGLSFYYVVFVCLFYMDKIDRLIKKEGYKEIYLTHSVYIGFGIPARVGLKHGADVYVTQNTRNSFVRKLSGTHLHQTPNFNDYYEKYEAMTVADKKQALAEADGKLKARLSGEIDSSIYYMKSSAYSAEKESNLEIEDYFPGRPWALIMLHCFFDSPHIYKWMIFPDFYEWLNHTLRFCYANKINVAVKRHPNGMKGNEEVVLRCQRNFPFAEYLSSDINNKALADSKIFSCLLTVYGTVAHEFSYLGVPVINAGDNPHSSFSFSKTPRSVSEYEQTILKAVDEGGWVISRDEVKAFYYMHYLKKDSGKAWIFDEKIESKYKNTDSYNCILSDVDDSVFNGMVLEAKECINGA